MPQVKDLSKLEPRADFSFFYEQRMENDANGNPIYIGYTKTPNAGTSASIWFIVKVTYDANQSPTRYQLPDNGVSFDYDWDSRSSFFS